MAKAKFDYATENVVRRGDELGQYTAKRADAVHLVMARRFDPARLELGAWVQVNESTQDESKAQEQFTYVADHMRSEGALSVAWVQVNDWHLVNNPEYKIGKYNCIGTVRDVRSSAMLQADGGVPRNVAMDAVGLALAVNHAMSEWIDSKDQAGDDAAKDQRDAGLPPVSEQQPTGQQPTPIDPVISDRNAQSIVEGLGDDGDGTAGHPVIDAANGSSKQHKKAKARKAS